MSSLGTSLVVEIWYNTGDHTCSQYDLINDSPSKVPNDVSFLDHRHDQSVFSLIYKTLGSTVLLRKVNLLLFMRLEREINIPALYRENDICTYIC